jgi:hypothetical protein
MDARQSEAVWVRESSGRETVVLAIKAARLVSSCTSQTLCPHGTVLTR